MAKTGKPHLEIVHYNGEVEQRPLEHRTPVSIGSHASSDIQIPEESVEPLQCRISWNKSGFEAVAAGADGLDLNGAIVQRATLKPGDVLRFGTVDIVYRDDDNEGTGPGRDAEARGVELAGIDLKPLSSEVEIPEWLKGSAVDAKEPAAVESTPPQPPVKTTKGKSRDSATGRPRSEAVAPASPSTPRKKSPAPPETPRSKSRKEPEPPDDDVDLDASLELLAAESRQAAPPAPREKKRSARTEPSEPPARTRKPSPEPEQAPSPPAAAASAAPPPVDTSKDPVTQRLRSALKHQRVRPGEEDILRSPLVLGLLGGGGIALLLAAIFYFIGLSRSITEEFEQAKKLFDEQKFSQAITELNAFITRHPKDSLVASAGELLGLARTDQLIIGAAPNYLDGMKQLKSFISEQRESPEFQRMQAEIVKRATAIALGAGKLAGKSFQRDLIGVSREAQATIVTFAPKDAQPVEDLRLIDESQRLSEAAILKHETHEHEMAAIDAAIKNQDALTAFRLRRELLARYPDLEKDKRVVAAMKNMLETERALAKEETLDREATREPRAAAAKSVTLVYQARTRTDQVSVNRAVPIVAKDSVYGIDTITGAPIWKYVIGVDSPFFPIRDTGSSSLIVFDSMNQELVRLDQNNGSLLWRQPIDEPVHGRPLLDEGQIFVPTMGGKLYRIDLETGTAVGSLTFSQEISNPVPLSDPNQLIVAGDREVFYTVTKRPFACIGVSYLGQPSQSIVAPLISMGPYVLAAQNQAEDTCRLRLMQEPTAELPLREVATADVAGHVVDPPVVRGRDLFVPSTGERVAAFQVSDDPGQPPLAVGPTYQVKGAQPCVTYLATAPDAELFMASTALRKLKLSVDSLQAVQETVLQGLASQPLQYQDRMLYVARQRPFSDAAVFTPIDRSTLIGEWQAVVGAGIIGASSVTGDNPSLTCVTTAGQLFRVTGKQLETGGFLSVGERLPLNEDLIDPLLATTLPEGQILVTCGLPDPKVWLVNRVGQIERSASLTLPMQAAPALLGRNLLVPTEGRLQLLQSTSGQSAAQEFRLPSDLEKTAKWKKVFAIDEENGLGVLDNGLVLAVRVQKSPRPNLGEIGQFALEAPLAGEPVHAAGRLALAANNGRVVVLADQGLEPAGDRQFTAPVTGGPWFAGEAVLVEVDNQLHSLAIDRELPSQWSIALDGSHVAGAPALRDATLIVPLQDGRALLCDAASGEVQNTVELNAVLSGSPVAIGSTWVIPTADGSLAVLPGAQP